MLAAALLVWLWVSLPLALGARTFFFRDVFSIHLPLKAFGAAELAAGRIPAFNPTLGMGQPFRGNPQALAFYPGNVLYLLLPFWSAFNLHFALHWLLALAAMTALARGLGMSRAAALASGLTYAGSGWALSGLSFYHVVAVTAWWPLVLLGGTRGGRRGIALGGVACGLALLGGEPTVAALGMAPLLLVALSRHGARRGLVTTAAIGALGALVALPQLVATARVLPFTFRGAHGLPPEEVGFYALHPVRLLELALPLPFGHPGELGALRFWGGSLVPVLPLILSLYFGAVGLALALAGARRQRSQGSPRAWAALAVAGLGAAWAGGIWSRPLALLSAGLFRYPEKFLFWTALAAALLAGWGLEEVLARPRRWSLAVAAGAAAALALAALATISLPALARWAVAAGVPPGMGEARAGLWVRQLLLLGLLLAAAAWAARRRSAGGLLLVQLAALLQLSPLVLTDSTAGLAAPSPWAARLGRGTAVVDGTEPWPFFPPPPEYRILGDSLAVRNRLAALDLNAAPGVLHGLTYPLAPDIDGFASPLYTLTVRNLPHLDWTKRVSWMRSSGVQAVVLAADPGVQGLERIDAASRFGVVTGLYRVRDPAPEAWWPQGVTAVAGPMEAFGAVSRANDPVAQVAVPGRLAHDPRGRLRLLAFQPDRVVLETEGGGGVAVIRRAFEPLLVASSGGQRLATLPVNLDLTGVIVPPGRRRVVLEVSAWPEAVAGAIALLALAAALIVGLWPGSSGLQRKPV